MMYMLGFLLNSSASDDVFDLSDKKAKVNKGNYYSFDIHHDAPTQNSKNKMTMMRTLKTISKWITTVV